MLIRYHWLYFQMNIARDRIRPFSQRIFTPQRRIFLYHSVDKIQPKKRPVLNKKNRNQISPISVFKC